MNIHADKTQENESQSVANEAAQKQSSGESTFQFVGNRPEAIAQRKLQEMVNNSPRVSQLKTIQGMLNGSNSKNEPIQRVEHGNLINFKTKSMSTGAATLHHEVCWESSTGSIADLAHIKTRERVSWDAAPPEFGPSAEYEGSGVHNGLGSNTASGGIGVDDHSIIPPGFNFQLAEDGSSRVWTMNQQYEMQINGEEWIPVPGGQYQITRWFERKGTDLIAYTAKRGINDGSMHRAMVQVPNWFES